MCSELFLQTLAGSFARKPKLCRCTNQNADVYISENYIQFSLLMKPIHFQSGTQKSTSLYNEMEIPSPVMHFQRNIYSMTFNCFKPF